MQNKLNYLEQANWIYKVVLKNEYSKLFEKTLIDKDKNGYLSFCGVPIIPLGTGSFSVFYLCKDNMDLDTDNTPIIQVPRDAFLFIIPVKLYYQ